MGVVGPIHCLRHLALVKEIACTHLDVEFFLATCLSPHWPPVLLHRHCPSGLPQSPPCPFASTDLFGLPN